LRNPQTLPLEGEGRVGVISMLHRTGALFCGMLEA
jgi:hypothetical protein